MLDAINKFISEYTDDLVIAAYNAELMRDIQYAIFGGVLADENQADVVNGIMKFAAGYPETQYPAEESGSPVFSFKHDLNYIILAIRSQYGINLSHASGVKCHWWEFLLMFHGLCGNHYITKLMEIRGYDGKDNDLRKLARRYAVPDEDIEYPQDVQNALEQHMFGGQ